MAHTDFLEEILGNLMVYEPSPPKILVRKNGDFRFSSLLRFCFHKANFSINAQKMRNFFEKYCIAHHGALYNQSKHRHFGKNVEIMEKIL